MYTFSFPNFSSTDMILWFPMPVSTVRYTSKNCLIFTFQGFHENMHMQLFDMVNQKSENLTFENQAPFPEHELNIV